MNDSVKILDIGSCNIPEVLRNFRYLWARIPLNAVVEQTTIESHYIMAPF